MKNIDKSGSGVRLGTFLKLLSNYLVFFLLVSIVVTCSVAIFAHELSKTIGLTLTSENLGPAAKLTFVSAVLLSVIFTAIDALRRRNTVTKPAKRMTDAAERMIRGDYSVRVPVLGSAFADDALSEIGACFNRMAEELGSVETLRSDFIANVSHEMKTPLSIIQNYATLLEGDVTDEERREYAKGIIAATRRTTDMMTNILKLNRLENQQIFPNKKKFDLGEALCECLLEYENVWEEKNIDIETELEEGVIISADEELLFPVWSNLFSNALKFTPEGGRVSLSLSSEGEYAVVRITDTGIGMTPEVGAHIFEKFYQGDASRASNGNGLGLALVKRVIDIVGGEISVESSLGEGSVFTVKIRKEDEAK